LLQQDPTLMTAEIEPRVKRRAFRTLSEFEWNEKLLAPGTSSAPRGCMNISWRFAAFNHQRRCQILRRSTARMQMRARHMAPADTT
jgi:hypothetical protein